MNVEFMSDPRVQMANRLKQYAGGCGSSARRIITDLIESRLKQLSPTPMFISGDDTTERLAHSFAASDALEDWLYNAWAYRF